MLSGVPVLVNDFEVMREITQDGTLATLYKSNNIEDCSEKMLELINHIDEYKEMAKTKVQKVKELYSIDNHINSLMHLYSDILWKN